METKTNEEKYPSVGLAYELAIKSYDWVFRRSEIMDDRIEKLIALATTINLAVMAFVGNVALNDGEKINFNYCPFYFSVVFFAVGMIAGLYAKLYGSMKTVSPTKLLKNWLHLSEWEFKKNSLYRASEDYEFNREYVNTKGMLATIASIAFLAEAIALILWLTHLN